MRLGNVSISFRRLVAFVCILAAMMAFACSARAQDIEPRAYANTPVGLNFLVAGYGYTGGGVAIDPSLPVENAEVRVDSVLFAYARSLGIFGKSAKFDVVLPYAWADGSATALGEFHDRAISGFADPKMRFSINLLGAPALSLKDFANYQQDIILGASLNVTAPGGQYDATKLLNIGTNRWSIKPEIGISKRMGRLTLELDGGVRFFTDNDQFFGDNIRAQKPMYSVQGHIIYSFDYGIWLAVDANYYTGGQTSVNGIEDSDRQENSRIGATLALPVTRSNSIKLYFSKGVVTRVGTDFDSAGILWQYRFGGGF
ncbi:transporter [Methylomonas sp. MgM2]